MAKPKGSKYRNLNVRKGLIYYDREIGGKRVRVSTGEPVRVALQQQKKEA